MRAIVIYLLDDTVRTDVHKGARITAKIHRDGRGYVTCDGNMTLYRHVEKITWESGKSKRKSKGRS
jgi:ATP-dependent Clp protease adapter protein ClpS